MVVYHKDIAAKPAGEGVTRRVLAHCEKLMPCELHMAKGALIPEHAHVHEQVSYIVSGSCRFTVGDEANVVNAGDSVYMPSNVPHRVEVLEDAVVIDMFTPMREDFV